MTNTKLDILRIDVEIKAKFEDELQKLENYKDRLRELKITIKGNFPYKTKNDLEQNIEYLEDKIRKIESGSEKNFYIAETAGLLKNYHNILRTPIKISFMGKPIGKNKEKLRIIEQYLGIAQKYNSELRNLTLDSEKSTKTKIVCDNCGNDTNFDVEDESIYICEECGAQKDILIHAVSYKDIDRVNISTKYSYDRKVHFRDCINQYQGKQNSTIEQKVYDDLEEQFKRHYLLVGDENTPKNIRFSKITKNHVTMFLKELGYTKHYENVNLIHYNFTGIKPDDISHLEDKLLRDFDELTDMYDKLFKHKIERTNFINTQYVLYQLLRRHKHPCIREDFVMIKTIERQSFHDDITRTCFQELGWNFSPSY